MKNKPKIYKQVYYKPVRRLIEEELNVEVYIDQSVKRYKTNTIFPDYAQCIDGIPLLNVYGQWIYNSLTQIKEENNEEEIPEEESLLDIDINE